MPEHRIGDMSLEDRVWRSARREFNTWYPHLHENGCDLLPAHLSAAYRALADYTLCLDAYEYDRGDRFPGNSKEDVAGRYGRYMHLLADTFSDIAGR